MIVNEKSNSVVLKVPGKNGDAYIQRLEGDKDFPLSRQEQVVVHLVRKVQKLEERIQTQEDMVRKELVGYWPGEDIALEKLLDNMKNDNS